MLAADGRIAGFESRKPIHAALQQEFYLMSNPVQFDGLNMPPPNASYFLARARDADQRIYQWHPKKIGPAMQGRTSTRLIQTGIGHSIKGDRASQSNRRRDNGASSHIKVCTRSQTISCHR